MPHRKRIDWESYALALATSAAVVGLRMTLDQYELARDMRFLLFATPIVIAAWTGGFWPGMFATALGMIAADYFFLEPTYQFNLDQPSIVVAMGLFLFQGLIISWLGQSRRVAIRHLEERVELRTSELMRANEQLKSEVSERLRAAEHLQSLNAKLEISNRELQDFASVASHDLQEPLRKIQAFGDRLRAKCAANVGEEGLDYLQRMQAAAERMQVLIEDLLRFARVTTKAQPFERVDLNQIAADVLVDLETRIEQKSAIVRLEKLPVVDADAMQMRQLFQNLIANALKFQQPGVAPLVRVYAENGESARIFVQDNGIGFDEKYLDRIFNVFQRLHGRGVYEGTGIGLAVCRKIVERHGGSITASSRPGEGATFAITLPMTHGVQDDGSRSQADNDPYRG